MKAQLMERPATQLIHPPANHARSTASPTHHREQHWPDLLQRHPEAGLRVVRLLVLLVRAIAGLFRDMAGLQRRAIGIGSQRLPLSNIRNIWTGRVARHCSNERTPHQGFHLTPDHTNLPRVRNRCRGGAQDYSQGAQIYDWLAACIMAVRLMAARQLLHLNHIRCRHC